MRTGIVVLGWTAPSSRDPERPDKSLDDRLSSIAGSAETVKSRGAADSETETIAGEDQEDEDAPSGVRITKPSSELDSAILAVSCWV
jgi:hypothetical protein